MMDYKTVNSALLARIQNGDEAARDELVEVNRPLVRHIAKRFTWLGPDPRPTPDELESHGLIGLWKASRRIHLIQHDNITARLAWWIRGAMWRGAEQDHRLHRLHGKRNGLTKHGLETLTPYKPERAPAITRWDLIVEARDERPADDLWTEILACCHDSIDRQIVEMRKQNHDVSYQTIAESLGLKSKSTVGSRLRKIKKELELRRTAAR
jgi:RNA polymerase sigma factor (sigma-70 family)